MSARHAAGPSKSPACEPTNSLLILFGHHIFLSYQTLNHQSSDSLNLLGYRYHTYTSGQCGAVDCAMAAWGPPGLRKGGAVTLLCLWRGGKSLPIDRSTGREKRQGSHDRAHRRQGSHTRAHLAAGSHDVIPYRLASVFIF